MVANRYWNDPIEDLPIGEVESFLYDVGDIVLYCGRLYKIVQRFFSRRNDDIYRNSTIACYNCVCVSEFANQSQVYFTNADQEDFVKQTDCEINEKIHYTNNYSKLFKRTFNKVYKAKS